MTDNLRKLLTTGSAPDASVVRRLTEAGFQIQSEPGMLSQVDLKRILGGGVEVYIYGGEEDASAEVLQAGPELRLVAFLGADAAQVNDGSDATRLGITRSKGPRRKGQSCTGRAVS